MDANAEGTVVYAGDNDGDLAVYDPRADAPVLAPFNVAARKLNTLHVRLSCGLAQPRPAAVSEASVVLLCTNLAQTRPCLGPSAWRPAS